MRGCNIDSPIDFAHEGAVLNCRRGRMRVGGGATELRAYALTKSELAAGVNERGGLAPTTTTTTTTTPPLPGIVDEPELPEEALRIFASMFECTPPHTPGMPPPVLDIS
jgi:hypothetical protein